jgi:hypothetical protein
MQFRKFGSAVLGVCAYLMMGGTITAQVTGGQFAFEFLRMSNSPHVSALGGISVANPDFDISLARQNPAMNRPAFHNQLQLNYNGYPAGIKVMNLQYGYYVPKLTTAFSFGMQFLDYGKFTETDNIGNVTGDFKGTDFAAILGASRSYGCHWRYGANLKFAGSSLGPVNATAALMDVGVNYYDTATLIDVGIVAKNMGVMMLKYNREQPNEPLPFDLQLGASIRLRHVPLRLFTTVHHLYEWNIRYDDPALVTTTTLGGVDSNQKESSHFADKLFRHFIFGAEFVLGKRIVITGSYNFLRRKEMVLESAPKLTGFAFGAALNLDKFQVHFSRSIVSVAGAYNEIGLTMALNKLFGLGQTGERMNWNKVYNDWE